MKILSVKNFVKTGAAGIFSQGAGVNDNGVECGDPSDIRLCHFADFVAIILVEDKLSLSS